MPTGTSTKPTASAVTSGATVRGGGRRERGEGGKRE